MFINSNKDFIKIVLLIYLMWVFHKLLKNDNRINFTDILIL
jgi:hypothetical protein